MVCIIALGAGSACASEVESGVPSGPWAAPQAAPSVAALQAHPAHAFGATVRGLDLRVVALPPAELPGFGPPRRAHHALSFRHEAPRHWLQSIGIDAVDCTTRVRFPSRLTASTGSGQLAAEVAAQVHFNCRF